MNIKEFTGAKTNYEDFKYVMQDNGNIYLGAKYSFQELLEEEMVPFKLKAIISQYILKEADRDTTLESQFYYLEPEGFLYETFRQLKVKVKVQRQKERRTLFGKKKLEYKEELLSLKELAETNLARKKGSGMLIREIVISKLAMMTFTV